MRALLRAALAVVTAGACAAAAATSGSEPPSPVDPARVLFVGNSLTYTNDVPGLVAAIARLGGNDLHVDAVTFPNVGLEDQWRLERARDEIIEHEWDVVVLQQGPSSLPESRRDLILWTRRFADVIRAAGAEPALYMVWPQQSRLYARRAVDGSYAAAAQAVDGILLPVGRAWARVDDETDIRLYGTDGFHPTMAGSPLAAMTIHATLFEGAISDLDFSGTTDSPWSDLDAETIESLARAADSATERIDR